ncbi:hypothetical protein JW826_03760 [Candidatus Woesearchaeota archaeon]|nr:hypothetical protein [Candidatus Woesearchaeota archaeon]
MRTANQVEEELMMKAQRIMFWETFGRLPKEGELQSIQVMDLVDEQPLEMMI